MTDATNIANKELGPSLVEHQVDSNVDESSLPPVDRGKDAWLFLAACWVVELLIFGMSKPVP